MADKKAENKLEGKWHCEECELFLDSRLAWIRHETAHILAAKDVHGEVYFGLNSNGEYFRTTSVEDCLNVNGY